MSDTQQQSDQPVAAQAEVTEPEAEQATIFDAVDQIDQIDQIDQVDAESPADEPGGRADAEQPAAGATEPDAGPMPSGDVDEQADAESPADEAAADFAPSEPTVTDDTEASSDDQASEPAPMDPSGPTDTTERTDTVASADTADPAHAGQTDAEPAHTPSTDAEAPDEPASEQPPSDASEQRDDGTSHEPSNDDGRTSFADLGLDPRVVAVIEALGYEEPTPIQAAAIPVLLQGSDLLGQAATGTGKTAAFALPIVERLGASPSKRKAPRALVLAPTRELAVQVSEAMYKYGKGFKIDVLPVFGGQPIFRQIKALRSGVDIVVATPGRAVDLIKRNALQLDEIEVVVLDEADEMLDMGFADELEAVLGATPDDRQTVLFSATMPKRIASIAKRYQRDPERIEIGRDEDDDPRSLIRQTVYFVRRSDKSMALGRVLDIEQPESALVFCRTRHEVDDLTVTMNGRGYRAEALHGGMDQQQRDRVMSRLRDGTAELLVATDVAARGIDVDSLTHVVNFDVPSAVESYVHRIGRVGRAGRMGVAITFAEPRERRQVGNIERHIKQKIDVSTVPSIADLRDSQIDATVRSVNEALAADDLADYEGILHRLSGEDQRNVALAALKLVHELSGATLDDEREITPVTFDKKGDKKGRDKQGRGDRPDRGKKGKRQQHRPDSETGHLYVGVGRKAGIRPGDLVGAIANEANLPGSDIGPIRIADHYSVVGLPDGDVERVAKILTNKEIRGQNVTARRYT